jgi:hypothetical protein
MGRCTVVKSATIVKRSWNQEKYTRLIIRFRTLLLMRCISQWGKWQFLRQIKSSHFVTKSRETIIESALFLVKNPVDITDAWLRTFPWSCRTSWAGKFEATFTLDPAPMWHYGRCEKNIFEVLYYRSFDSHIQKKTILKIVKIPNLAQKRSFPHCVMVTKAIVTSPTPAQATSCCVISGTHSISMETTT